MTNNLLNNDTYKYYPDTTDDNFQNKIYEKREFYKNKILPYGKSLDNYQDIKEYRDSICGGDFKLYTHQSFLSNFINPNTPYKGLLIFHGVGTGKTGGAISIAENFKNMVLKYGTKIHILVPGPIIKKNWKDDIIKFTNKTYYDNLKNQKGFIFNDENIKKELWNINSQYYKILSYKSFYKKVLGEKIKDFTQKKKNRKVDGKIERELSLDKIENLNNTLIIIDEVHNLVNNEYGLALKKIIDTSVNLKIILLSATPMKNIADDIIEIINYLRPVEDKIKRDKIFNNPKYGYLLDVKPGGVDYLRNNINGYISYYRGAHPLLFAKQVDIGTIPKELKFTKVIQCYMEKFQEDKYLEIQKNITDTLEKTSESIANLVIPGLNENNTDIIGYNGLEGIRKISKQLENNTEIFLKLLNKKFFNNKITNIENILKYNDNNENINGLIFKIPYLKFFSTKFYTAFTNLDELVEGKKGAKTAFIYSNLVKLGIEIFEQILLQNGYLAYKENQEYNILENTKDYLTGIEYNKFIKQKNNGEFIPATFLKITGQIEGEFNEIEIKKDIIDNVFNKLDNYRGKNLKFILGSKVMTEGITLENTGEVHILDVHYNLGKTYQVIGRGIRQCKHYNVMNEDNPYPKVNIYRYVIYNKIGKSAEIEKYKKAEYKYILVKKIERILKESAIDCPINYSGNVFPEEVKKFKNCEAPKFNLKQDVNKLCPDICDFMECSYKCNDLKLNTKYYDKSSNLYKLIEKKKLDYSTFTIDFIKDDVIVIKNLIKKLYKIKYVYTIEEIITQVKILINNKLNLFDNFFVYQALNEMIPLDENDFNNFKDIIYDKFNRSGYLIYINKYYIYQPFDLSEYASIYYRNQYNISFSSNIGISNLISKDPLYKSIKKENINKIVNINYDFISNENYYNNRIENDYVGIIDKLLFKKIFDQEKQKDIFKLRGKKDKNLEIKRGTGIPSIKGAVCGTSNNKNELIKIAKKIGGIETKKLKNKIDCCSAIRYRLLYLEKYSTGKNIKTYMIIPANHDIYYHPYNLEDRIKYIENKLKIKLDKNIKLDIKKESTGIFEEKRDKKLPKYILTFNNKSSYDKNIINKYKFKLENNKYKLILE